MENRVSKLEQQLAKIDGQLAEIKALVSATAKATDVAEIKGQLGQMPKATEFGNLKAEIARLDGRVAQLPTIWQLFAIVLSVWGVGIGIVFTLIKVGLK